MTPNDNPDEGTVEDVSVVDALAGIIDDPETETDDKAAIAEKPAESEEDPDVDDPEDEEGESEDLSEDAPEEESDEPEYANGRFAADSARVKLPDGTTATIAELKEGQLRQSDYTRKTQALAEERKAVESTRERIGQATQQLQAMHEQAILFLEQRKPQRPESDVSEDPMAHMDYQNKLIEYNEAKAQIETNRVQAQQALEAQNAEATNEYLRNEQTALFQAVPAFQDKAKQEAFVSAAADAVKEFGYSEQDVRSIADHRMILVLRELVKARRLQAKAPKVKGRLEGKPQIVKGSRRAAPNQAQSSAKKQRAEMLRNEGSMAAGVAALMDIED